jgi:hypothetical protein
MDASGTEAALGILHFMNPLVSRSALMTCAFPAPCHRAMALVKLDFAVVLDKGADYRVFEVGH